MFPSFHPSLVVSCPPPLCHSWSECAVDNNDDDGEDRDGDEQWYLSRTQDFCANAAFSLYGVKKGRLSLPTCSRANYINSFFTYGGADTLLRALKRQPSVYYNGEYVDGWYNSNYATYGNASNSDCVVDNDLGMSSTMGCSARGVFALATFEGDYCHGSDFSDIVDPLTAYNRQMGKMGCHKIWGSGGFRSSDAASSLLANSWSCDLDLYPNGCPDPYGKKKRYDYALRAVAHGQNPSWAVANMQLKRPLRIVSWLLIVLGAFFVVFGYNVRHRHRMAAHGGGLRGFFRVMSEDLHLYRKELARKRREAKLAAKEKRKSSARSERSKGKKSRKSKKRSSRSGRRSEREVELSATASSDYEAPRSKSSRRSRRGELA